MRGDFFQKLESELTHPNRPLSDEEQKIPKEQEIKTRDKVLDEIVSEQEVDRKESIALLGSIVRKVEKLKETKAGKISLFLGLLYLNGMGCAMVEKVLTRQREAIPLEVVEEAREIEEVKKKVRQFLEEIQFFKSIGYKPIIMTELTAGASPRNDQLNIAQGLMKKLLEDAEEGIKTSFTVSDNPLQSFHFTHAIDSEVPIELSSRYGHVLVMPFSIESKQVGRDEGIVRFYHWLRPDAPILYEKRVRREELDSTIGEMATILKKEIKDKEKLQLLLDAMPIKPELKEGWQPVYEVVKGEPMDEIQRNNIKDVLEKLRKVKIEIEAVPQGEEVDRVIMMGGIPELTQGISLELDREKLEKINFSPLRINGQVKEIRLERDVLVTQRDDEAGTINGEKWVESYVDRYGNLVIKFFRTFAGSNEADKVLWIYPQIIFSREKEPTRLTEEVKLDLSRLGLPDITGLFHRSVELPLTFIGPQNEYGVYSNMEHEMVKEEFGHHFERLQKGISRAENLFGFCNGEKAKNLYIVNAKVAKAFFYKKDPGTVVIQDELLRPRRGEEGEEVKINLELVSFHEAIHLIDTIFNLSKTSIFQLYFSRLKEKERFFYELNEYSFLPEMDSMGHAQDNEGEFLASFLNSLNHPQWEEKISSMERDFQEVYLKTLEVLETAMEGVKELTQDAPIRRLLQEKIDFLKEIAAKASG